MSALSEKTKPSLVMSESASRWDRFTGIVGEVLLFLVASSSMLAVLFIILFIAKDAIPFFWAADAGVGERFAMFFGSTQWYPTASPPEFGVLGIIYGSLMVTVGAVIIAVPVGICAAVCLSDLLPFEARQIVKPIIELMAAIPSVAYGFFAMVVLAPMLQNNGGQMLEIATWVILAPLAILGSIVVSDLMADKFSSTSPRFTRGILISAGLVLGYFLINALAIKLGSTQINSGTNALNVSIILGIMALPTVVSVSEDALQAVGVELRAASYGLGATRAETLLKAVVPAASSGICAAVILGVMRAIGETMVVWMASGNAARIPQPWYNLTDPVRTLTATIAGDMGEADHTTGSARYHVLFAMALTLLIFCFVCNLLSEWVVALNRKKLRGE